MRRAASDRDWTKGSIIGNLLSLGWPMMVGGSLNMLGPTIDMIWVGKLGVAAIALAEGHPHPRPMTLEEIDQFFSPLTKKRTDQYGGSLENRSRLLMGVIAKVRERVGKDFPIMVRISGSGFYGGRVWAE